ncbi:MAG TPA: ergothioneine biosynthesis protein EgtC [Mycobacteriales bacterium]|nr:ergothioneine biosynthesis protein EgtC [Mycobacteriales bacterium]
MCRHLAWLGAPRSLATLVLDPPHGLREQSYAPRRQQHGVLNADGWGVGYFTRGRAEPARWRSSRPLWGDASFASVAPTIVSGCVIGAVRSATIGMPIEDSAVAPFTDGRWLLSHNGQVDRSVLPHELIAESTCDSAMLAAAVFAAGPDQVGAVVTGLAALDPLARLNLLLADGSRILATTWGDTLSYLLTPDGVAVASEPYDDDHDWVDVPDRHLLDVTAEGLSVLPLESP